MAGAKVVETVILGAGALIAIYWGVTHQDQLKGYWDKFIMSAMSQLQTGGSTGPGTNTSGSDNTPATTATPSAPYSNPQTNITGFPNTVSAPPPTAPAAPPAPTPAPVAPTPQAAPPISPPPPAPPAPQTPTDKAASILTSTIIPPTQAQLDMTKAMMQMQMVQMQTDMAANQLGMTILPVDPNLVNNTGMPSIVGQTPMTSTGRNMKQMTKAAMPRVQTPAQKKAGQIATAKQKGNVIVPASMANQFCQCTTSGRWGGPGCNVGQKFCGMVGQKGMGK